MSGRRLDALRVAAARPTDPVALDETLTALRGALYGWGPALVPVPSRPGAASVLAMARLDQPLEAGADGEPVALVVPTSGSTGDPKGALLTATAIGHSAEATHHKLGGRGQWLLALPLTHIAGLQVLIRSLYAGVQPVAMDLTGGFDPDRFAAAEAELGSGRRYTSLVPTQLRRLLDGPAGGLDALAGFDAVLVGGAALDPRLRARAVDAGVRVVTTYGMTETCGGCVYDGVPIGEVEVDVPEAGGQVRLGGPVVFSGYRLRPDLTATALELDRGLRWHVTADVGWLDKSGCLQIGGRLDDVVVTGGEKVTPGAVEAVLGFGVNVQEVVVVGVPDPEWGQRLVAVVVPADSAAPDLTALRTVAARFLPPYALPRQLVLVPKIPQLASGKPDRAALRRRAEAEAARAEANSAEAGR